MNMITRLITVAFAAFLAAAPAVAFEVPEHDHHHDREFRHPDLWWGSAYRSVASMPADAARDRLPDLATLGVHSENAYFDLRTGRWGTLILTQPMIPGSGAGNHLQWSGLDRPAPRDAGEIRQAAWDAFRGFLAEYAAELRFDTAEFGEPVVSMHGERLIQIHLPRQYEGILVRDSFVAAAINSGNLVLMGERNWADLSLETRPSVSSAQAGEILRVHLGELTAPRLREAPRLEIVPVSGQPDEGLLETAGDGLDYRLVWVLSPVIERDIGVWEALVDAHGGELLAFQDTAHYAERRVGGGVYPVSNDGQPPDGVEQPGWPMPFANISLDGTPIGFSTTGGNVPAGAETGTISTTLNGQYVRMNDNCGAINESAAGGDLDLGDGPGTDCAVPPGASAGNTHASRSGFYELNRIIEQGRGYLPDNGWLQGQLVANMNINNNCNAGWNGQVNFFTSGGGCANTGEIAAVFDHEWGHGMDNNDGNPTVSRPGEGIADIYAQNRLNDSCVGRGFRPGQNCGGFGDACLECTGVRESDWAKQQSGQPHDISWILTDTASPGGGCINAPNNGQLGPCGEGVHCEGSIVAEASWDLVHRDLRGFDGSGFNYDLNTALELGTRLAYYGSHTVGNWYQCVADGTGGCNADGGYLNYLAANDDNGDLTDGTPHMSAIFAAFNRHQIACPTPVVQDAGCSGGPQAAPQNVQATPIDEGAFLTWDAVPDAEEYWVFRTEGVHGCDFGKTRVGITTDTEFTELGLRNEFEVLYSVVAVGDSDVCTSPMSACTAVMPFPGPSGIIQGTVTRAATGIPLEGAMVQATGPAGYTRFTDAGGGYEMTVLEGIYEVSASGAGHDTATETNIVVEEDGEITLDFSLDTPIAEVSPAALEIEVGEGGSNTETLEIANLGTLDLSWNIETYVTEGAGGLRDHDPDLDETLDIADFVIDSPANGGSPAVRTVDAGLATRGEVVGFSFQGTVSGISGQSSWASDMCMIVQSPDGAAYAVGGFSGTQPGCNVNQWEFGGSGSTNDGTYSSTHDGIFEPAQADEGGWTFTFINDWSSSSAATMNWTGVTLTLHKAPLPICQEPGEVSWLSAGPDTGMTAPGGTSLVQVTADAGALAQGVYEAYLCLTTNDAEAALVPVPVQMTVTEPAPGSGYGPPEVILRTHPATPEYLSPGDTMSGASPAINDAGEIAARVNVAANNQAHGLWWGDDQGGEVVVERTNTDDLMSSSIGINGLGEAVFELTFTGSDNGIWVYDPATGDAERVTTLPIGATNWSSPRIDDDGIIGFRALFSGSGRAWVSVDPDTSDVKFHATENSVQPSDWEFLHTPTFGAGRTIAGKVAMAPGDGQQQIRRFFDDGSSELIAETTATDPGSPFTSFNNSVGMNEQGDVVFVASRVGGGRGVFLHADGDIIEIAVEDAAGPVTEIEFFSPDVNNAGQVVFRAFNDNGDRAVWVGDGNQLVQVAKRGDTVQTSMGPAQINRPDSPIVFGGNPAINNNGTVVFSADLVGACDINTWFGRALLAVSPGVGPIPGQLAVIPDPLDFGTVEVGASAADLLTVANVAGNDAGSFLLCDFQVTGDAAFADAGTGSCEAGVTELEPGQECSIEVIFSPGSAGEFDGELSVSVDNGQASAAALTGTGLQQPGELGVSPESLDFGAIVVGGTGLADVTVSNLAAGGAADLELTQIEVITGQDVFAIEAAGTDCGETLAPETSCTVMVSYSPDAVTDHNGVLRISAEGKDAVNVALSGNGIELEPGILEVDPLEHDFGELGLGDSDTVSISVANTADAGAEALTLTLIDLSGAGFLISGGDCEESAVLEPGVECLIEVSFGPDAAGGFSGELDIATGDGQAAAVALIGTGVQDPGELGVDPGSLDFGNVVVDSSQSLEVTVSNLADEGSSDLVLTQIEVTIGQDVFAVDAGDTDCGSALAPQASCTVSVTYSPAAPGAGNGVLRIDAEGKTAVNVPMSGNGIEPDPTIFEDRFEEN